MWWCACMEMRTTAYATAGTLVVQNGVKYVNNWWTQGNNPTTSNGGAEAVNHGQSKQYVVLQRLVRPPVHHQARHQHRLLRQFQHSTPSPSLLQPQHRG